MVNLYTDQRMIDHKPHAGHPERPERLAAILRHLDRTGQKAECHQPVVRLATDEELLRVHTRNHIETMKRAASRGGGQIEADTWISNQSETASRLAAGAVVLAVDDVVAGRTERALCLVRPPGHHARPDEPMGFCLYGSVAVAAADAVARLDVGRVLIVDWDVHHGNGTQEMFYENSDVCFFSIHRHPFYPGSGASEETGTGAGLGTTKNVPIAAGTSRRDYLDAFSVELANFADHSRPDLILLSAGFDAHAEDPVGNLGLETEDFDEMTKFVIQIANQHTRGQMVTILEGGYNVPILAGCVANHLKIISSE